MSETPNNKRKGKNEKGKPQGSPNNLYWIYAAILLVILVVFLFMPGPESEKKIQTDRFWQELVAKNRVKKVLIVDKKEGSTKLVEVFLTDEALEEEKYSQKKSRSFLGQPKPQFHFKIASVDNFVQKLNDRNVPYEVEERTNYLAGILTFLLPIVILVAIYIFFMRRISGGVGGSQLFNVGKSKALLYDKESKVKTTFKDVAGLEEAKQEVMEVVEFLKSPARFTRLGGHIPKGVLLVGPPGTGKTLLAKAVAGEAGVPFFSLSGSDFVEMFVGVGAARVRDLFKQAKEKAPCIIFIDEIDAIGRSRGRGNMTGSNDERENTLNQLLVEMDGFNTDTGVILMAATNRPDVLDTALQRPGRFDRLIAVDKPDLRERQAIFEVHLKNLVMNKAVDAEQLASQTPGFVGADIMNVCNEAALFAARRNKDSVEMSDFQDAIDRVIGGLEKRNRIIQPEERKVIAYHEAGHAVCGWYLENSDPLVKVTIIPRGVAALGFAQYLPQERYIVDTETMDDTMCMTLGGRAAEEIIFSKISTGAQNDLERVTRLAYDMVSFYGMSQRVGNVSFNDKNAEFSFGKPYSENLAQTIDEEARKIIQEAYERAKNLLLEKKDRLIEVAERLLKEEVLYQNDLEKILGPRANKNIPLEEQPLADPNTQVNMLHPAEKDSGGEKTEEDENGAAPGLSPA